MRFIELTEEESIVAKNQIIIHFSKNLYIFVINN